MARHCPKCLRTNTEVQIGERVTELQSDNSVCWWHPECFHFKDESAHHAQARLVATARVSSSA